MADRNVRDTTDAADVCDTCGTTSSDCIKGRADVLCPTCDAAAAEYPNSRDHAVITSCDDCGNDFEYTGASPVTVTYCQPCFGKMTGEVDEIDKRLADLAVADPADPTDPAATYEKVTFCDRCYCYTGDGTGATSVRDRRHR